MTGKRYARSGMAERVRQLCRRIDFFLLLTSLRLRGHLPGVKVLRRTTLIELGPGPTRLAVLKRRIFAQVIFLDQSDFGIPDPGLRLANFERMEDVGQMLAGWCGLDSAAPALFTADHCLEHVSEEKLLPFLSSLARSGHAACFRVPNTLSARGLRSFQNDATHCTAFEPELRSRLESMGFVIFPWMRWYRPLLLMNAMLGRGAWMTHAEEIVLCAPALRADGREQVGVAGGQRLLHDSFRFKL
jgi:hypothetical protein